MASAYVAACRAEIRSALESGDPEPELYPHPDDVVIVPGQPFQIMGPTSKDEAAIYRDIVATRDLFIMQATLAPIVQEEGVRPERPMPCDQASTSARSRCPFVSERPVQTLFPRSTTSAVRESTAGPARLNAWGSGLRGGPVRMPPPLS